MSQLRLVQLLAAAALLCDFSLAGHSVNLIQARDKHDVSKGAKPTKRSHKQFVRLTSRPPPAVVLRAGEGGGGGELTCVALGSPAPVIRWYRNNMPLVEPGQYWERASSSRSVARVSSTLSVAGSERGATYTCRASAGRRTDLADTRVYGAEYNDAWSERIRLGPYLSWGGGGGGGGGGSVGGGGRIVSHYLALLTSAGSRAALRCRAARGGSVLWTDPRGIRVRTSDRMQVLESGTLVIRDVRWSDMGLYTCTAVPRTTTYSESGVISGQSVQTFLYPLAE